VSHPLPLVTITLTTDELAMASAGVTLLRRTWASALIDGMDVNPDEAKDTIERCSLFLSRLSDAVTPEQGQTLLSALIKDLKRRP